MKDWLRDHPYDFIQTLQTNFQAGLILEFKIYDPSPLYLPNLIQEFKLQHFELEKRHTSNEDDKTLPWVWKAPLPEIPKDHFFHDYYKFSVDFHEITFERIGCYFHPAETEINQLIHYLIFEKKFGLSSWNLYLNGDGYVIYEETGDIDKIFIKWMGL